MPQKSHPIQARYAQLAGMEKRINLHAEILALIRARDDVHTIQVVRTSRAGMPKASFPCKICMGYILDTDVKEIIFHNQSGNQIIETI
jgi:deoxycytidylate deaminase